MTKDSKIFVAGGYGLTGSAIVRELENSGYTNIVRKTHKELDLTNQKDTFDFFRHESFDYVFLCAAKVGGILANNTYRANFIYENLSIQNNVIHASYLTSVKKLLFLGTTCIYPKESKQPIKEEYLLTGELEYTNEPYAIAKIAGLKMCESYNLQYGTNFISVMPTGIYGENDSFDFENAHVLPTLVRKFHLAKLLELESHDEVCMDLGVENMQEASDILEKIGIYKDKVTLWGSGNPRREFMYSSDMAKACIFVMENIDFSDVSKNMQEVRNTHINIGIGEDVSIKELALIIKNIVGFNGKIVFDSSKPDGTFRKLPDCSRLYSYGFRHTIELKDGIEIMYDWYKSAKVKRC